MMKHVHIFNHDDYHTTLKHQIGNGIPVFSGVRQQGGGLGGVLGFLSRYAVPLIKRYIFPHAKKAVLNTAVDLMQGGSPLKSTLKRNVKSFANDVTSDVLTRITQKGKGIKSQRKPSASLSLVPVQRLQNVNLGLSKKSNSKQRTSKGKVVKITKRKAKKVKSKTKQPTRRRKTKLDVCS